MKRILSFGPAMAPGYALLAVGCCAIACSPAQAQDAAPLPPSQPKPDERAAKGGLDEIIVTARRRPEPLQRTPVSVILLSDRNLEARSVTNTRALQNFVPNLTFAASQNVGEAAGNVFIRGIGQEDFGLGAEPGVGFYVDGIYFARPLGTIMALTDVERIEVLRGPQGTLFGKNTIGGAINLVSKAPGPAPERRFSAILGNLGRGELRATINEALSADLFARLSLTLTTRDGYLRRLPPTLPAATLEQITDAPPDSAREGAERSQAARLRLRWLLDDTVTIDFSLDGSRKRGTQGALRIDAVNLDAGVFPLLNRLIEQGRLPGPTITEHSFAKGFYESNAAGDNFLKQGLWGASATMAKDLGHSTLKFIGGYRTLDSHVGTDVDGLQFNLIGNNLRVQQRQFSGELQLSGDAGRLAYTAGVFGLDERGKLPAAISIPNAILVTCGCFARPGPMPKYTSEPRTLTTATYAGYAQGTYRLSERLSATLGGRLSNEIKTIRGEALLLDSDLQPTEAVVGSGRNRDSWNSFTYRAGVEFQATAALMAYGSIAKGFKSGGFNVRGAPELPNLGFYSFEPETALTYEIGVRSDWLDRKLRANATLFHTAYRDIQLRQQTLVNGLITTLIDNAARARIRGAEVELTAAPTDRLTLSAVYGHLAPRYLDVGQVSGLTLGTPFQRTPRHSWAASADYRIPLASGTLQLHGDYSYRSKEQFQITPALNDQRGYGLLGARATFHARGDRWVAALFATNLTKERYRTAGRGTLLNQAGLAYSSIGMPRQIGIQLTTSF